MQYSKHVLKFGCGCLVSEMNFGKIVKLFVTCVFCCNVLFMALLYLVLHGDTEIRHAGSLSKSKLYARLSSIPSNHNYKVDNFLLLGNLHKVKEAVLTIGIVSVSRPSGAQYLHETLKSLMTSSADEQLKTQVLILLPEPYPSLLSKIESNFTNYLDSGFLIVLGPVPEGYYPPLSHIPISHGDNPERIQWRAKQNLDYAFLWRMAMQTHAKYYLQLEDDVLSASNYYQQIMDFINLPRSWAVLDFSRLGFIGKLFKIADLNKMASLSYHFYAEQPVDYLLLYFRQLMNQKDPLISTNSLFQHIGKKSSLKDKEQLLIDEYFDAKDLSAQNPAAMFMTSLPLASDHYSLTDAYTRNKGYFWARWPAIGDWFSVTFNESQTMDKLTIKSGNPAHPDDLIHHGKVETSVATKGLCLDYIYAGKFEEGKFEMTQKLVVKCFRVTITEAQNTWILISDIAVYVSKK